MSKKQGKMDICKKGRKMEENRDYRKKEKNGRNDG